jgi:hypothetical protein
MYPLAHNLTICWGAMMIALAGLLIYRSLVAMKEEDLLFLDPAESHLQHEQLLILARLRRLTPVIRGLVVASIAILAAIIAILIYQVIRSGANPT